MAKQSKAKARKKAQNKALLANTTKDSSNSNITTKNSPNKPQNGSDTVIIDDHLNVEPTKADLGPKEVETPAKESSSKVAVLKKVVIILLAVIVVLLVLLWYFYAKTHKASYSPQNSVSFNTTLEQ